MEKYQAKTRTKNANLMLKTQGTKQRMKGIFRLNRLGENSKIVAKNVIGAFIVKGLSLIISFATTPLFIHYFNDSKVLGIWYTLLSILIWFLNFDLGIGNGIRNNLVKAISNNDWEKAKSVISSGVFSVGLVSIVLAFIGAIIISSIDLNSLLNIDVDVISPQILLQSTVYIFIAVMLRFFFTTISSVFYALQKSAINNFIALCVSILQMLFVLVFEFDEPEIALKNISLAYIFLSNIPILIAGIVIFTGRLRNCRPSFSYIDKNCISAIIGIGFQFFLCQILYMIIANTNELIITNLYGAECTTEYTFYYKLATIGTMIVSLALTPLWSVVTKAQSEENYRWLYKLYNIIRVCGVVLLIIQLVLVPFIPWLMRVWLGEGMVDVSILTALSFALFGATFMYTGMLSTIANGLSMMKIQIISYTIAVLLKLVLVFALYSVTNWVFVVWVNTIILIPYIVSQQFVFNRFFKTKMIGRES